MMGTVPEIRTQLLEGWSFKPGFEKGGKLENDFIHLTNDSINNTYIMKPQ